MSSRNTLLPFSSCPYIFKLSRSQSLLCRPRQHFISISSHKLDLPAVGAGWACRGRRGIEAAQVVVVLMIMGEITQIGISLVDNPREGGDVQGWQTLPNQLSWKFNLLLILENIFWTFMAPKIGDRLKNLLFLAANFRPFLEVRDAIPEHENFSL